MKEEDTEILVYHQIMSRTAAAERVMFLLKLPFV